jgi:hypothetical protein
MATLTELFAVFNVKLSSSTAFFRAGFSAAETLILDM